MSILRADARHIPLRDGCVQCVVTSPPYWGLRDYGVSGQIGLEPTPEAYVATMVAVFREVRRVLRDDGTVWLNLGDSYAHNGACGGDSPVQDGWKGRAQAKDAQIKARVPDGLKPKDLCGIPWSVAKALQAPYYTGAIKNEGDRIWLAAMLDAEGCMFIHKRKAGQHNGQGYYRQNDSFSPGIEISNTSLTVVERIMALVGKGSISSQGPEQNGRRKQTIYRWNLRTNECRELVRELYPYLVAKQQQARILYDSRSSGERAQAAHQALMDLHRKGLSDVDAPTPPSCFEPGWYLRSDVIWSKSNPMPESVTDRPTRSHEYLFLLAKNERYFYDSDAIKEAGSPLTARCSDVGKPNKAAIFNPELNHNGTGKTGLHNNDKYRDMGRNKRSVWTVNSEPTPEAHFATFPQKLVEPCILAGTSEKGCCAECGAPRVRVVERTKYEPPVAQVGERFVDDSRGDKTRKLSGAAYNRQVQTIGESWQPSCSHDAPSVPCLIFDPFIGSGTVGKVAERFGRRWVGCELSADYIAIGKRRTAQMGMVL